MPLCHAQLSVLHADSPATSSWCSCSQVTCVACAGARASLQHLLKYGIDVSRNLECLHAAGQAADTLSPVRVMFAACMHLQFILLMSGPELSCARCLLCLPSCMNVWLLLQANILIAVGGSAMLGFAIPDHAVSSKQPDPFGVGKSLYRCTSQTSSDITSCQSRTCCAQSHASLAALYYLT